MVDAHRPTSTPHTPPKPNVHTSPAHPAQGSVDPKEHPPTFPAGAGVTISHAPPLPVAHPTANNTQKPVMETGDAEQEAGRVAMDTWKKRQAAEEEAGKAAVQRHAMVRSPALPPLQEQYQPEQHAPGHQA